MKKSGYLKGGSVENSGESPAGVGYSGEASGRLVSGEIGTSYSSGIKWDKDGGIKEVNLVQGSAKASGSVVSGKASGSYGVLSGNAEGKILAGEAKATGKVVLVEDGKFAPQLTAEAKAGVDVAKGSIGATLGNECFNGHANANGELLHADAHVGAGIGKITYEDEKGEKQTGYGVYAEAGAEAYLAKGSISGGLTICGVKIDVSVEGKAGGAGAKGEFKAETGKLSAGLGLGFLLGGGVNVSIDWTGFKWPGRDSGNKDGSKKSSGTTGGNGQYSFCAASQKLEEDAENLQDIQKEIARLLSQIEQIKGNLEINDYLAGLITKKMNSVINEIETEKNELYGMSETLVEISKLYTQTECNIMSGGL